MRNEFEATCIQAPDKFACLAGLLQDMSRAIADSVSQQQRAQHQKWIIAAVVARTDTRTRAHSTAVGAPAVSASQELAGALTCLGFHHALASPHLIGATMPRLVQVRSLDILFFSFEDNRIIVIQLDTSR